MAESPRVGQWEPRLGWGGAHLEVPRVGMRHEWVRGSPEWAGGSPEGGAPGAGLCATRGWEPTRRGPPEWVGGSPAWADALNGRPGAHVGVRHAWLGVPRGSVPHVGRREPRVCPCRAWTGGSPRGRFPPCGCPAWLRAPHAWELPLLTPLPMALLSLRGHSWEAAAAETAEKNPPSSAPQPPPGPPFPPPPPGPHRPSGPPHGDGQ